MCQIKNKKHYYKKFDIWNVQREKAWHTIIPFHAMSYAI